MCCGQKRAALRNDPAHGAPAANPRVAPNAPHPTRALRSAGSSPAQVTLRYLGGAPMRVRGPVSGQVYSFSPEIQTRAVDARDAIILLRMPQLRRVVR